MFQKISKYLRFCFFFPIAILSPALQQKIQYILWYLWELYKKNSQITGMIMICMASLLFYFMRSASIYAYDENNIPVCIGHLPLLLGYRTTLYLPQWVLKRAETTRLLIRIMPLLVRQHKKEHLLVKCKSWQIYVTFATSMHFEIPLRTIQCREF